MTGPQTFTTADGATITYTPPGVVAQPPPPPPLSGAPVNTTPPLITGGNHVGDTLQVSAGKWTGLGIGLPVFAWYRDKAPIAGAHFPAYVNQAADVGHSVSASVTEANGAGEVTAASSNAVAVLGPATPPPPPVTTPPVSGGPNIGNAPVKVGAKIFDSIDRNSVFYDSGQGGTQVFGTMNNMTNNQNGAQLVNGILVLQPGSTICTLPKQTPGTFRPGLGASTGFVMSTGIIQTRCRWPGSGDAVTDWAAAWMLTVLQGSKREPDYAEAADWGGGAHQLSFSIHHRDGGVGPNVVEPPGNWADGQFHDHVLITTKTDWYVVWDGQVFGPYPQAEPLEPMFSILSAGSGSGALEVESNRVWSIG